VDATQASGTLLERAMPEGTADLRWGFIGPGRIAANVAADLHLVDGAALHAVASRSLDRAEAFADRYGAAVAYGSYGELLVDPNVDAIYIATPHRQHHAIALAGIAAGKHLLVEKAFTCTLAGAREVVAAARTAGVFCMEAMWTRFQPAIVRARELITEGAIGDIRAVRADLGVRNRFDPLDRLWARNLGGGALLDLGVYTVAFVQMVLGGSPEAIEVAGTLAGNGVDAEAAVLWRTADSRAGFAHCSLASPLPGTAAIFGAEGWIEVPPRFHHPREVRLYPVAPDGRASQAATISAPAKGVGYAHEFDEVHRCIAAGLTESPVMPLDDTLAVIGVLEQALHRLGVHFDEDDGVIL
jgi:predicted dehydrogenase